MPCTRPRSASQVARGAPLNWSKKKYNPKHRVFQLPCGKCIDCRLRYGRTWAIRCMHEAEMHRESIFLTLTYNDEHLGENRLDYRDFQDFIREVRRQSPGSEISYIVAGEYGKKSKRKYWHAIIFGFRPRDASHKYTTDRGDKVSSSSLLDEIWGRGNTEFGAVTLLSAGYVARYSAKKLVHGNDDQHCYSPIFKVSSKYAIGKRWIERNWRGVFDKGFILGQDGTKNAIPRYYEKWFEKEKPPEYSRYVTGKKQEKIDQALERSKKELSEYREQWEEQERTNNLAWNTKPKTKNQVREVILKQKFDELQKRQKDT